MTAPTFYLVNGNLVFGVRSVPDFIPSGMYGTDGEELDAREV